MVEELQIKRTRKGKLVYYKTIKQVKKIGNGGHILMPKELIGRLVCVSMRDKNEK